MPGYGVKGKLFHGCLMKTAVIASEAIQLNKGLRSSSIYYSPCNNSFVAMYFNLELLRSTLFLLDCFASLAMTAVFVSGSASYFGGCLSSGLVVAAVGKLALFGVAGAEITSVSSGALMIAFSSPLRKRMPRIKLDKKKQQARIAVALVNKLVVPRAVIKPPAPPPSPPRAPPSLRCNKITAASAAAMKKCITSSTVAIY